MVGAISEIERRAFDFVDATQRTRSSAELSKLFDEELRAIGCISWLITGLPEAGDLAPMITLSGWSQEWTRLYTSEGFVHVDAVARYCHHTLYPFEWSEAPVEETNAAKARLIMNLAREHRMVRGLCVPVRDRRGLQSVVTMSGEHPDFDLRIRPAIHLMSMYVHMRALTLVDAGPRPRPRITPREAEVLRWAAVGKTAWEIGEILSISEGTVRSHVKNAAARLGVFGLRAAVSAALGRGEVAL